MTDQMIFRIGLCLAAACFMAGIFFNFYYRVPEPVFLLNDKAVAVRIQEDKSSWSANLSLRYISDVKDERKLARVEFPELEELGIEAWFENDQIDSQDNVNSGGLYVFHTVRGTVRGNGAPPVSGTRLTRGIAYFLDGTSKELELGEVTLFVLPEDLLCDREPLAQKVSSASSSDGSAQLVYRMKTDGAVRMENGLLPPKLEEYLSLTVNGKALDASSEIKLKAGELLVLKGEWKLPPGTEEQLTDRRAAASFTLISGEEEQPVLFSVSCPAASGRLSRYEVWRYLRERGTF